MGKKDLGITSSGLTFKDPKDFFQIFPKTPKRKIHIFKIFF